MKYKTEEVFSGGQSLVLEAILRPLRGDSFNIDRSYNREPALFLPQGLRAIERADEFQINVRPVNRLIDSIAINRVAYRGIWIDVRVSQEDGGNLRVGFNPYASTPDLTDKARTALRAFLTPYINILAGRMEELREEQRVRLRANLASRSDDMLRHGLEGLKALDGSRTALSTDTLRELASMVHEEAAERIAGRIAECEGGLIFDPAVSGVGSGQPVTAMDQDGTVYLMGKTQSPISLTDLPTATLFAILHRLEA